MLSHMPTLNPVGMFFFKPDLFLLSHLCPPSEFIFWIYAYRAKKIFGSVISVRLLLLRASRPDERGKEGGASKGLSDENPDTTDPREKRRRRRRVGHQKAEGATARRRADAEFKAARSSTAFFRPVVGSSPGIVWRGL